MLLLENGTRTFLQNRQLGSSLAFVAGALNAAGFLSVGYYCANMTGNVSLFANAALSGKVDVMGIAGGLVLCFLLGAITCTLLVNKGRERGQSAIYAYSVLLEALLLAFLGGAHLLWFTAAMRSLVTPWTLAFLMGMQNATVTRISGAVVRTTHVTGMITDLGIEIAEWLGSSRNSKDSEKHRKMQKRLWLHSQIIFCFLLGCGAGVYSYKKWPEVFLLGVAVVLASLALPGVVANMQNKSQTAEPGS